MTPSGGGSVSSGLTSEQREAAVKSMRKTTIGECAEVIPGVLSHGKPNQPTRYSYITVQPVQLTADGLVGNFGTVARDLPCAEEQLLQNGDILIKRLNPDCAVVFHGHSESVVASANVFAIRAGEELAPAFLAFLLEESSLMQRIIQRSGVGSTVSAVTAQQITNCEIPLPPLELQYKLGELWKLNKKEGKLLRELLAENALRLRALCGTLQL